MNLFGAPVVVGQFFFEEEIHLSIVGISAIWDNMCIHKHRFLQKKYEECVNDKNPTTALWNKQQMHSFPDSDEFTVHRQNFIKQSLYINIPQGEYQT